MVNVIEPVVDIFIRAYNALNDWFTFLFKVDENSVLYQLGEFADNIIALLPDWLENGAVGTLLHGLVDIGTEPLIASIFGTTLIICIAWSIVKFILPT